MAKLHNIWALFMVLGSMLTVHVSSSPSPIMENCRKMNPCSCLTDSGLVLDLSPLDSMNYLQPAFKDVPVLGNSTDKFSWNPCTPFCEIHCENAATCQVANPNQSLYYTTGQHSATNFSLNYTDQNLNVTGLVITYDIPRVPGEPYTRNSIVRLLCDEDGSDDRLVPYGETGLHTMQYFFDVVSKYACPRKIPLANDPQPTLATTPLVLPTCPHPWEPSSTEEPTKRSTEVTTRSTTPEPIPVPSPATKLWIAIAAISVVLLILLVFVIVLILRRGSNSHPGTIMLPVYDNSAFSKPGTDDTKGLIKF